MLLADAVRVARCIAVDVDVSISAAVQQYGTNKKAKSATCTEERQLVWSLAASSST
jgi:hypothetical protein